MSPPFWFKEIQMAFTFNSTAKGTAANSYVSLEDADDFFDGDPRQSIWDALTDVEKQQYLVWATNRLEYEKYGGQITSTAQRLQWPRNFVTQRDYVILGEDRDYGFYDADTVPKEMQHATFEMAMWYVDEINETPTVSRSDMARMTDLTIGPLAVKMRKISEAALPDIVKRALNAIGPNGWLGGQQMKLVR